MTISPFRGPNRFPLPAPSPPTRAASNKSPVKSEQVEADRSVEAPRSSGHPISTAALKYLDGDVFPNGGSLVGPNARAPAEVPGKPVNNNDPDDRSRHKQSQEPTGLGDSDALRQPAVLRRQLLSRRETLDTRALLYDNSIMVEESVIRTTETSLTVFVCGVRLCPLVSALLTTTTAPRQRQSESHYAAVQSVRRNPGGHHELRQRRGIDQQGLELRAHGAG